MTDTTEQPTKCFRCDGTGQICDECGESEAACQCEGDHDFSDCEDCGGTGK